RPRRVYLVSGGRVIVRRCSRRRVFPTLRLFLWSALEGAHAVKDMWRIDPPRSTSEQCIERPMIHRTSNTLSGNPLQSVSVVYIWQFLTILANTWYAPRS